MELQEHIQLHVSLLKNSFSFDAYVLVRDLTSIGTSFLLFVSSSEFLLAKKLLVKHIQDRKNAC